MADESKILVAIARLEEKHEHLESYIFKDLRPDIERLCTEVTNCMDKAEECTAKNFKWMVATIFSIIVGSFGWVGFLMGTI